MMVHLLDPDPRMRCRMVHFLTRQGIAVSEAAELSASERVCEELPPTAVIVDPTEDPVGTVLRLREIAPGAPILVWTAPTSSALEETFRWLGCGFIAKPALSSEVAFELGRLAAACSGLEARPGRASPGVPPAMRPAGRRGARSRTA